MLNTSGEKEPKTNLNVEKYRATKQWIENRQEFPECELEDMADDVESIAESSIIDSSEDTDDETTTTTTLGAQTAISSDIDVITENLKDIFSTVSSVQTVGNVDIRNSSHVHIGNVININGNININQTGRQHSRNKSPKLKYKTTPSQTPGRDTDEERVHHDDAFINRINFKIDKNVCNIVPRRSWLAQRPMESYEYMQEPVEFVIISHTATESSEKQAINTCLVRDIQVFHIEGRKWNDISYNFLVGCDGNVYEGRGWAVVGAHTLGYNKRSIGISFIGCFMQELPSKAGINAFKMLLKRGVTEGHLAENYKLICHCQCGSTESPGRKLFEEIVNWEHFHEFKDEDEDGQSAN